MASFLAAAALSALSAATSTSAGLLGDSDARARALASEARLETILEIILERNPHLVEAHKRAQAAREGASARSRLPDLELKYEQWGVPLRKPWGLDDADTLMLGLRQTFPAPGTLGARERSALREVDALAEAKRARALDLVQDARRAYAEYYRADREYRIHLEHVVLAEQIVELARTNFQTGRGDQANVLRAVVDVSRLHRDIAAIEQARFSASAFLNTLMDRAPNAALGPALDLGPLPGTLDVETLEQRALAARPEVRAAEDLVLRSEADVDAAERGATWPSFMVGVDYWFMPTGEVQHAYGAMVSINLPWLNPRHGEEVREAEKSLSADRSALSSAKNTARFELHDRAARYRASRSALTIIDERLLPEATKAFEAARASFTSGTGSGLGVVDALKSLFDVRLESVRARSELFKILADVERAAGHGGGREPPANEGEVHE
jgi:outer membrane protein TolC